MKSGIKFSIAIPAYKSQYLKDCISSILNQTYSDFELLIINDCSPNPVDEIVAEFKDSRIQYFKNDVNTGAENVVLNFNKCLEKASGEFFILMGDDDKMEPDYLEEFLKLIGRYDNLNVFHCRSTIIDENSQPVVLTLSWPEFESVYDNMWHRLIGKREQFISDFVYRTSALRENGGFYFLPLAWGSDDVSAYIAIGNNGIAHINKPVFNYRRHRHTITSTESHELKIKAIDLQKEWINKFLSVKPSLQDDLVIHNDLCKNLNKVIQRKKVNILVSSLDGHFFKIGIKFLLSHKRFGMSVTEVLFSFFEFLKLKRARVKYYQLN
jgi:glycosyltransferase involved in cell wall biosynthesis